MESLMYKEAKDKPVLLVLVGPTAVGKTKLSIEIAQQFQCEVISGDSMQVYRHMNIGTAKITPQQMKNVSHHCIDIHEPDYRYSVAEFHAHCRRLIPEIHARGNIPFIVGGTGLYIEAVCYRFHFADQGEDASFREEQFAYAKTYGALALHQRLQKIDPTSAERIHPNDQRRVVRALEVFHLTGKSLSAITSSQHQNSPYHLCMIGLTMNRQQLYARIEQRVDDMIKQGLVDEVEGLLARGLNHTHISMQSVGYKHIAAYLQGQRSWEDAVSWLKQDSRRLAKKQMSWFRHMKHIVWVDLNQTSMI